MPLPVSGAFHSPLMAPAAKEMGKLLARLTWNKPHFPVYSNVTGEAVTDGESLRELAGRQMTSSVLWIDSIAGQYRDGVRRWLEIGPKGALSRMVKPIVSEVGADEIRVDALGSLEAVRAFSV
jgi:[acyl-carrier-protein] S-malonyltransferase